MSAAFIDHLSVLTTTSKGTLYHNTIWRLFPAINYDPYKRDANIHMLPGLNWKRDHLPEETYNSLQFRLYLADMTDTTAKEFRCVDEWAQIASDKNTVVTEEILTTDAGRR